MKYPVVYQHQASPQFQHRIEVEIEPPIDGAAPDAQAEVDRVFKIVSAAVKADAEEHGREFSQYGFARPQPTAWHVLCANLHTPDWSEVAEVGDLPAVQSLVDQTLEPHVQVMLSVVSRIRQLNEENFGPKTAAYAPAAVASAAHAAEQMKVALMTRGDAVSVDDKRYIKSILSELKVEYEKLAAVLREHHPDLNPRQV